jgi:hypothetical protein
MNTNPFATYTSPNGLVYRVTGVEMVEKSGRWIDGVLRYHWLVSICFIESDERISLEYDYNEKIIKKFNT